MCAHHRRVVLVAEVRLARRRRPRRSGRPRPGLAVPGERRGRAGGRVPSCASSYSRIRSAVEDLVLDVEVVGGSVVDRRRHLRQASESASALAPNSRTSSYAAAYGRASSYRWARASRSSSAEELAAQLRRPCLLLKPVPGRERPRARERPTPASRPWSGPRTALARPSRRASRCRDPGAGAPGAPRRRARRGGSCPTWRCSTREADGLAVDGGQERSRPARRPSRVAATPRPRARSAGAPTGESAARTAFSTSTYARTSSRSSGPNWWSSMGRG